MKQYLVFGYDGFYPGGGMNDYIGSYDNYDEAYQLIKGNYSRTNEKFYKVFYQIYDVKTNKTVTFEAINNNKKLKEID